MNRDWLKNLKAGDEVIVQQLFQPDQLRQVKKVTPSGVLVVEWYNGTELRFTPYGDEKGGNGYHRRHLVEATSDARVAVERVELIREIGGTRGDAWAELPIADLREAARLAEAARDSLAEKKKGEHQ